MVETGPEDSAQNQVLPKASGLKGTVTVGRAILWGTCMVNGPVFTLCVGPLAALGYLQKIGVIAKHDGWIGLIVFPVCLVLAWSWWSFMIPKWRLWAYERVENIQQLKAEAVQVGLTWPEGHVLGKTEWKSDRQRHRENELDPPETRQP